MDKQSPGSMGGTYAGNPISCAAAVATQHVIREESLIENSGKQGSYMMSLLRDLQSECDVIKDVRGLGCMIGVEFDESVKSGLKGQVAKQCAQNGMLILPTSIFESIRFIPPLIVTQHQMNEGFDIFKKSLNEVLTNER